MSSIVFRKPASGVSHFAWAGARLSRWLRLANLSLVALLFFLLAWLLYLQGVATYRARGLPVAWSAVAAVFGLLVATSALVTVATDWLIRKALEFGDRYTSVWLEDEGLVLWMGVVGTRMPYAEMTGVRSVEPGQAPRLLGLFLDRRTVAGVRVDFGRGFFARRPQFLLVDEPDRFIDELRARAANRGLTIPLLGSEW